MKTIPEGAAMEQALVFDPDLIARYDQAGPRYTSYPTAVQFHDQRLQPPHARWVCRLGRGSRVWNGGRARRRDRRQRRHQPETGVLAGSDVAAIRRAAAQQLAQRIKTIGGRVPGSMENEAGQKYLQPPKDTTDVVAVIRGVIAAEEAGVIREAAVDNASAVEYGTVLFYYEPVA